MGGLLNSWTNGRMNVKIFHSMQLGGEKEALEQVQVGAIEMTRVSVGVVGPIVEDFNCPTQLRTCPTSSAASINAQGGRRQDPPTS